MSDIEVQLPDGSARSLPEGSTAHDLAAPIGKRLAKDALAAQVNGQLDRLDSTPLPDGATVAIVTPTSDVGREVIRHSTAHVLAQAVTRLWPGRALRDRSGDRRRLLLRLRTARRRALQ